MGLNDARTKLADFFNSLLDSWAGLARMLRDSGRSNEFALQLRGNPKQLIPMEIDEDHDSTGGMLLPLAFAVL